MNKIILKGLVTCVVASYILTGKATESPSTAIRNLLGDYADFKGVVNTPVKTKVVEGSTISPTFKEAVSFLRKQQKELSTLQQKATLKDKTIEDIASKNKELQTEIDRMVTIQKMLVEKYKEIAKSAGVLEAATALKMRLTEEIQNIKLDLSSSEKKGEHTGIDYITYRYTVESTALKLVTSIDSTEKRKTIPSLAELYNSVMGTLKPTQDMSSFTLSDKTKKGLKNIFESLLNKEVNPIQVIHDVEDTPNRMNLENFTD